MRDKFIYGLVHGQQRIIGAQYNGKAWTTKELAARVNIKECTMRSRLNTAAHKGTPIAEAIVPRRSRADCAKLAHASSKYIRQEKRQSIAILAVKGPAKTPPVPDDALIAGKRRHRVEDIIESRRESVAMAEIWDLSDGL